MVCYDEGSAQCIILNMMPGASAKKITLMVRPSEKVSALFNDIKNQMQVDNFDISLQSSASNEEEVTIKSTVLCWFQTTINIYFIECFVCVCVGVFRF